MTYIPATSSKEFLVETYRKSHSYGKLIMMSIFAIHISCNLEHFIRSSCKGSKKIKWFLQVTSQLTPTSLALAKTDLIMRCNEQGRMNDLVEIVVGEVAVLQLYRMKIRISCC